ncbi:hypothetical protein CYY_008221 [Polysphondylium violaceum]|uniref:Thioredoxin domain-containing protein n=1 Tax=Polysphondylium violaceum TaxID=133409 RepID=A0A8J4UQB4_9MYCE|nr:hypothetical protein CYY_008221 [Polysphondylium violaceum]
MIKSGDKLPLNITLWKSQPVAADGSCPIAQKVTSGDLFANKKVVLFALPGAFTPTCSSKHLPGFIALSDKIKSKGIQNIYCLSTDNHFVNSAWSKDQKAAPAVDIISDGNSEFTKAIGLEFDGSAFGLGKDRTQRYAMIVDNGVVGYFGLEGAGEFEKSKAETVLEHL